MATVTGKTSSRIDQLLAKLVTNLEVINGNLIITQRDGSQLNAGGVGSEQSIARLFYANGAYPPRPTNMICIEWVGPVLPPEMTKNDSWVNTA